MKKIFLILPVIFFIADRIFKHLAPSINFEGGFVKIGFYPNYFGAFSLPISGWLYNIAGIILLMIFIYLFYVSLRARSGTEGVAIPAFAGTVSKTTTGSPRRFTSRNDRILLAYCFIILGGFSNIFDRLLFGYTIDYINFLDFSFFNIADGMLMTGIVILLYCHIVKDKKRADNLAM